MSILKAISLNVSWYCVCSYIVCRCDFGFKFGNEIGRGKMANSRYDMHSHNANSNAKTEIMKSTRIFFFAQQALIIHLFIDRSAWWRLFICLRALSVSCWLCFVFLPPLFRFLHFWWDQISRKKPKTKTKKNIQIRFGPVRCVCVCLLRWFHRVYHKSANIMLVRNGALVLLAFFVVVRFLIFFFSRTNQRPMTRRKKTTKLTEQECAI